MNKENIVFKGTRDGLHIVLPDTAEFPQIMKGLKAKLEAAKGFFQGAEVTMDIGDRKPTIKQKKALSRLINGQAGLSLKGFTNEDPQGFAPQPVENPIQPTAQAQDSSGLQTPEAAQTLASSLPVTFIRRNLRCGQNITFPGHVVVLGDVNPGAEILAHGNIIVIGALRGLVHAGLDGDQDAFVAAFRLEPSQLRIAGVITRSPDEDTRSRSARPEVARLRDGNVVVEQGISSQTLSLVQRV